MVDDLFDREQQILDNALSCVKTMENEDPPCGFDEYKKLVKEYGRLLRQLRRLTKISDKTTVNLHSSNLDLLDKLHFDTLTGIYNRRYMDERLQRISSAAAHQGGKLLSAMMLDVDFFKQYNDFYGHDMGDHCLKDIASILKNSIVRQDDFVARYGGEEFIAILPDTDRLGAQTAAQRILEHMRKAALPHAKSSIADHVTISIGIATGLVHNAGETTNLVKTADKALYLSKKSGRDRFTYLDLEEDAI